VAIALQPVCGDDEAFLLALYATTRGQEIKQWGWPGEQVEAFLQMQFRAQRTSYADAYPDAAHDLIIEHGKPVGRLYVSWGEREVRLIDISLLPEARGRGIGSKLIRQLIDDCRTNGKVLRLQVLPSNPARHLYLRLGFRRTGGDAMYDEMMWSADNRADGE
jgi:ribosomal protein S18 acetylase RimI-like enzyme